MYDYMKSLQRQFETKAQIQYALRRLDHILVRKPL